MNKEISGPDDDMLMVSPVPCSVDGIPGTLDGTRRTPTPNQLRLSNKLYALRRPMTKLALLAQLGISAPEIYRSKNLEKLKWRTQLANPLAT